MEQSADTLPAINARLLQVRQALDLNQEAFASLLGLSRSYLSNIEVGKRGVSTDIIKLLIEAKAVSAHWLLTGQGAMFSELEQANGNLNGKVNGQINGGDKINHVSNQVQEAPSPPYKSGKPQPAEIIVATQDTSGNPTYTVVGHRAAANYLGGYQSQEYIENLGAVSLPRAIVGSGRQGIFFQIEGDSMTPKFHDGDWVACTLLDRSEWHQVRDSECYVVVSTTYGIQFKRIKNRLTEGFIRCQSDNHRHRPYNIAEEDLLQLFRFVLHVSPDDTNPEESLYQKVDHLEETTTDLRLMYEDMQQRMTVFMLDVKMPSSGQKKPAK